MSLCHINHFGIVFFQRWCLQDLVNDWLWKMKKEESQTTLRSLHSWLVGWWCKQGHRSKSNFGEKSNVFSFGSDASEMPLGQPVWILGEWLDGQLCSQERWWTAEKGLSVTGRKAIVKEMEVREFSYGRLLHPPQQAQCLVPTKTWAESEWRGRQKLGRNVSYFVVVLSAAKLCLILSRPHGLSPALQADSFTTEPPGKPQLLCWLKAC